MIYIVVYVLILFLIVYYSKHLLLVLLLLEFITFRALLFFITEASAMLTMPDALLISLFSVFVIEGVISLSLLILLVSYRGVDYLSIKNFIKF